jgi:hypothetical protein
MATDPGGSATSGSGGGGGGDGTTGVGCGSFLAIAGVEAQDPTMKGRRRTAATMTKLRFMPKLLGAKLILLII